MQFLVHAATSPSQSDAMDVLLKDRKLFFAISNPCRKIKIYSPVRLTRKKLRSYPVELYHHHPCMQDVCTYVYELCEWTHNGGQLRE